MIMIIIFQLPFHTTLASLFEMELEPNTLDWNENELEHEHELDDLKRTINIAGEYPSGKHFNIARALVNLIYQVVG